MAAFKSLMHEAKAIQLLVKELHGKIPDTKRGTPVISSWKFPGKAAIEVDFDSLLKDISESSGDDELQRSTLLELLVDRLLFAIQLLLVLMSNGRSSVVPLTFSTVLRKLSKGIIKREEEEGRKQNQSLLVSTTSSHNERDYPSNRSNSSTQTIETCFSVCDACDSKNDILVFLIEAFTKHYVSISGKPSSLDYNNLKKLLDLGRLRERDVKEGFTKDLTTLTGHHNELLVSLQALKESVIQHRNTLTTTEEQCNTLSEQVSLLNKELQQERDRYQRSQDVYQRSQDRHQRSHDKLKETYEAKIMEAKKNLHSKVVKSEILLKELAQLKQAESGLREKLAVQESLVEQLNKRIEEFKTNETQMKCTQSSITKYSNELEAKLKHGEHHHEQFRIIYEQTVMELRKAKMESANMDKRYKRLVSEHHGLVNRYKVLDDQTASLMEEREELKIHRNSCHQELQEMRNEIGKLEKEFTLEKEAYSSSVQENKQLQETIASLKDKLSNLVNSRQLLMEYPFVSDITSIKGTAKERERCVSANTERILLLEEQNSQIRNTVHSELSCETKQPLKLVQPIKLWMPIHHQSMSPLKKEDTKRSSSHKRDPIRGRRAGRVGHMLKPLSSAQQLDQQYGNTSSTITVDLRDHRSVTDDGLFVMCPYCDCMCLSLETHVCDVENNNTLT